jgi:hypothetical protein
MLIAIDGLPDGMLIAIDGLPDGMLIVIDGLPDGMLIAIDGLPHQVMLAQMREEGLHREIAVLAARPKVSGWFRRQEVGPVDPATPTGSPAGGTGGSSAADAHDDEEEEDEFDEHQQAEISAEIDALAAAAATKYASLERDGKVERCERDGAPPREREGEVEGGAPAGGEAEQGGSSAADLPAKVAALRAEAAQLDRLSKETGDDALKAQAAAKLRESQLLQAQIDQQGAGASTAAGGSAGGSAEGMAALQGQLKEARAKIGSLRALLGRAVREHCRASIDLAAREARAPPPPPPPPPSSSSTASFTRGMDTSFSKDSSVDSSARHVEKDTVFLEASSTGGYRDSQGHGLNPMRMTMSDGDGSWDDDDSDDDEEDDEEESASAPSPERTGGDALGAAAGDSFADFGAFGGSPERGAVVGGEPAPAVEGIQNVLRDLALRAEVAGAAESSPPTATPKLAEFVAFELPAPPTTMPMAPPTAPPSALVSSADFAVFDLPPQGSDSSGGDSSFGDSSSSSGSGGGGEEEGGNKGDDQ